MNAIPQSNPDFYIAGGTLDSTASSYIVRQADKELLDAVKGGQFCYILTLLPQNMYFPAIITVFFLYIATAAFYVNHVNHSELEGLVRKPSLIKR